MAEKHFMIAAYKDKTMVITPLRFSKNPNTDLVLMKRQTSSSEGSKAECQCWVLTEENMIRTFYRNGDKHFYLTDMGIGEPVQVQEYEGKSNQSFTFKNDQIIGNDGTVLSIQGDLKEKTRVTSSVNKDEDNQLWNLEYQ